MDRIVMKNKILYFIAFLFKFGYVVSYCKNADISVQPNFDMNKYIGVTWYEQRWLPEPGHPSSTLSQDFQHTYHLHPDGTSITAFVNGRDPPDLTKCFYYTIDFTTTKVPGKWLQKNTHGEFTIDYWIVSTDYMSYSVAYGCQKQDASGACVAPLVWVWSRKPEKLTQDKLALVEDTLEKLCVNKSTLLETEQNNECSENKECRIYSIDSRRQKNFDIRKYAGKWFEMGWLPQSFIPADELFQDYQHVYDLSSDGTFLTAFIRGRDPADLTKCFYNQGQLLPTSQPGKFEYRRRINATYVVTTDYWVMGTDYVNYAVVYGCRKLEATGMCSYADSWIWSRFSTLPSSVTDLVDAVKSSLCVNTTMYLPTEQTNECSKYRDCTVSSIVQRAVNDFSVKQMKGLWYKYSFLPTDNSELVSDFVMVISNKGSDERTVTAKARLRYPNRAGLCRSEDFVIHQTDTAGKILTSRKVSTGIVQQESYIVGADNTSYYVEYSCRGQDANSKCSRPAATLWSRTLSLTPETFAEARSVIIGLCLNYDSFTKMEHSHECPTGEGATTRQAFVSVLLSVLFVSA